MPTRLLLKVVMQTTRWAAAGLSVGDLIMARRQLLNLKHLAERHHRQRTARILIRRSITARVKPQANATLVLDAVMPYPRQKRTFSARNGDA